jgi:hypothetical protein
MESDMRDAIDIFEYAEHGHQWTQWVMSALHRLHAALHWAGEAFTIEGLRRAG